MPAHFPLLVKAIATVWPRLLAHMDLSFLELCTKALTPKAQELKEKSKNTAQSYTRERAAERALRASERTPEEQKKIDEYNTQKREAKIKRRLLAKKQKIAAKVAVIKALRDSSAPLKSGDPLKSSDSSKKT